MAEKSKFTSFDEEFEDETAILEAEGKKEGDDDGSAGKSGDDGKNEDAGTGKAGADNDSEAGKGDEEGAGGTSGISSGKEGLSGSSEEGKTEEGAETSGADGDGGERSGEEGKTDEGKVSEGVEGKDEKKGTEGKKDEGKEEPDFFTEAAAKGVEGSGEETKFSYKPLAEKLGIALESDDESEFTKKVTQKIEASKQEINLENYNEQTRSLIDFLNKGNSDIGPFITNPAINEYQGILNMEPEDKVRMVRINEIQNEQRVDVEKAIEIYNDELNEMSVSDIRKLSDNIDKQAKDLRDQEIKKIIGDREAKLKEEREKQDKQILEERKNLRNYVQEQENFLGIKLSPQAKKQILTDLDTGRFDDIVEKAPEASKFFAYMTTRFGPKIIENFSRSTSDANREGYNNATDKHVEALHKTQAEAKGKTSSGHVKGEEGTKKNFDTWGNELFESEES